MYSGTGVCAGQAHWQSTTLWKYSGAEMSVFFIDSSKRAPYSAAACATSSAALRCASVGLVFAARIRGRIILGTTPQGYLSFRHSGGISITRIREGVRSLKAA